MTTMPTNFIMEQLSWAYVRTVVYRAGWQVQPIEVDYRGIDGTIAAPVSGINKVDFQLKSTTDYTVRNDNIVYDLRVENYNQLVAEDGMPKILILFLMPNDPDEWLSCSVDELCLRKSAYWASLMGKPRSTNSTTARVEVPVDNLLSPDGLRAMFDAVRI